MRSRELANKISSRLVHDIVAGTLSQGQHVGAQQIADKYGVSRTPVREALSTLEEQKILIRHANRGYFVADELPKEIGKRLAEDGPNDVDDYQSLADDWLTNQIPEEVTEQFLRQRYGWTKANLGDVLVRASREGWIERKEGYGWRFLSVAKTPAAFDAIYRFRLAIEPVAILEPSFNLDRKVLDRQRRIQEGMLNTDIERLPSESLLENGALFHEEIIRLSGNVFFLTSLQRVNRMRRLMEYRADVNGQRLIEQCTEHLEILSLLETGNTVDASFRMRQHLSGALEKKSPLTWSWAANPPD